MSAWSDATLLRVARDVEDETVLGICADLRKLSERADLEPFTRKTLLLLADKIAERPRVYAEPDARVNIPA